MKCEKRFNTESVKAFEAVGRKLKWGEDVQTGIPVYVYELLQSKEGRGAKFQKVAEFIDEVPITYTGTEGVLQDNILRVNGNFQVGRWRKMKRQKSAYIANSKKNLE